MPAPVPNPSLYLPFLASPPAFNPLRTSLGAPLFWLDASQLVLADGDAVSPWSDVSGNGHDFTQSTTASKPTYKTAIQNGLPIVRFDGTNDALICALDLSAVSTISIVVVMSWNTFTNNDKLLMEFTPNYNNSSGGFLLDPNSSVNPTSKFGLSHKVSTSYTISSFTWPSNATWHEYIVTMDKRATPTVQTAQLDGATPPGYSDDTALAAGGFFANDTLYLMSRNQASLFGQADVAEVLLYTGLLTSDDVSNLHGYHQQKWALP